MNEESVVYNDENANPFEDSPITKNMASEILVESKTLEFTPTEKKSALRNSLLKSNKSVRIHSPSLKQTAAELLRKQTPRRPPFQSVMATSTPL
jgi:hypothetical protein